MNTLSLLMSTCNASLRRLNLEPTTVNYSSTQMSQSFVGPINTSNSARTYILEGVTLWAGYITGTEAKVTLTSDYGDFDGAVLAAINGGAFAAVPRNGQVYTLFSGPQAKRFVEFRVMPEAGSAAFVPTGTNTLSVTGAPASYAPLVKVSVGSDSPTALYNAAVVPSQYTGFTPYLQATRGRDYGSNVGSVVIRGAFKSIAVSVHTLRKIGVIKNGGEPVFYTAEEESSITGSPCRMIRIPCDGSVSTYHIWDDGCVRNYGGTFSVLVDSPLLNTSAIGRMDQYGDSQTYGEGPGATPSDVETMRVAAKLGYVGSTNGISGLTIEGLLTLLDTVLPLKTVSVNDVAVLAIGGNNAPSGITAENQANYLTCINKLLTKGYRKILCRGILPLNSDPTIGDAANVLLKQVVTDLNNPKVVWVDTHTWTPWGTVDGVHPNIAGYQAIGDFALRDYPALLV